MPPPWVALNQLLKEHVGSHDTGYAVFICTVAGLRAWRKGPDRALSIHREHVPAWVREHRLWRIRLKRPARRRPRRKR